MIGFLRAVREDIRSVFERDPAARSYFEVLTCYPGLYSLWSHHLEHWLWVHGLRWIARWLSQISRFWTGIEIHPGAELGRRVFIDHGMGVVIGETTIVGDDVTLYQGVTLGGTGKEKGKRHPTLMNNVFVGAGARILGNITIGANCRVGAGSVVLRDVPDNSTVVGVPAHVVLQNGKRVVVEDPKQVEDPLDTEIQDLMRDVRELKEKMRELTGEPASRERER